MKLVLFLFLVIANLSFAQDTFTMKNYVENHGLGFNRSHFTPSANVDHSFAVEDATLPATWDWRDQGVVSPVKDQGQTGDCWAFSATGGFESAVLLKTKQLVSLSEQFLNDCNPNGYNGSTGGDFPIMDFQVSAGQPTEDAYPFAERNQRCKQNVPIWGKLSKWGYVGGQEGAHPSVDQIRAALIEYGPLPIDVAVGNAFQSYSSGVLNREDYAQINHMVLLVGYDHTKGYWIVKNSWGSSWGENGYLRMVYGLDQVAETTAFVQY